MTVARTPLLRGGSRLGSDAKKLHNRRGHCGERSTMTINAFTLSVAIGVAVGNCTYAQSGECLGETEIASIAGAQDVYHLNRIRISEASPYRVKLAFALRASEISDRRKIKEVDRNLLSLLPTTEVQRDGWRSLANISCDSFSLSDVKAIGRLIRGSPRGVSAAVARNQGEMPRFLHFVYLDTQAAD